MDKLLEKIERLKEFKKALLKPKTPQVNMSPTQQGLPKPPDGELKMPSLPDGKVPNSKKNPKNVAQQLKSPDQKKFAMQQAKETIRTSKRGQWSLK